MHQDHDLARRPWLVRYAMVGFAIGGAIGGVLFGALYAGDSVLRHSGGGAPGIFETLLGLFSGIALLVGSLPWTLVTTVSNELLPWVLLANCLMVGVLTGVTVGFLTSTWRTL